MSWSYKVPEDTAKIVGSQGIENFGLEFYRFCRWRWNEKKKVEEPEKRLRGKMLQVPEGIKKRCKRYVNLLCKNGYCQTEFIASPQWRMVIGLGTEHPQETSMTLHHIYGIPYIPGSAIKGITRHWVKEMDEPDIENIERIFGTPSEEGEVIFLDAFPENNIELEVDVMNPHYPEYYTSKKPPADYQSPKPILFLTVGKDTKFRFYLVSKDKKLLDKAKEWLKSALSEHGIGAKTAVGYGYLEERRI